MLLYICVFYHTKQCYVASPSPYRLISHIRSRRRSKGPVRVRGDFSFGPGELVRSVIKIEDEKNEKNELIAALTMLFA